MKGIVNTHYVKRFTLDRRVHTFQGSDRLFLDFAIYKLLRIYNNGEYHSKYECNWQDECFYLTPRDIEDYTGFTPDVRTRVFRNAVRSGFMQIHYNVVTPERGVPTKNYRIRFKAHVLLECIRLPKAGVLFVTDTKPDVSEVFAEIQKLGNRTPGLNVDNVEQDTVDANIGEIHAEGRSSASSTNVTTGNLVSASASRSLA
jgi:hypothetical protein